MLTIRTLTTNLTLAAALVLSATGLQAQITPIKGSGCPGVPGITVSGTAKINTALSCNCPFSIDRMRVIIGLPSPKIVFSQPFTCLRNCAMPMLPLFLLNTSYWRVQIPNNTALVGQSLVVQCLQTSLNRTCVILTPATTVKIQR